MLIEKVTAEWLRDQEFLLRDHNGFPILMSQPDGVLGADLLPLSLIGCTIWDVTSILRKQKQDIRGVDVEARSEREDEAPWRFIKIHIHFRIWGVDVKPEAVERALRLTEEKYCSVYLTLKPAIALDTTYKILASEKDD